MAGRRALGRLVRRPIAPYLLEPLDPQLRPGPDPEDCAEEEDDDDVEVPF